MKDKKIILMATIRCNLFMAKNATNKNIKATYVTMLKQNVIVYKKLLSTWNKDKTQTIVLDLVA